MPPVGRKSRLVYTTMSPEASEPTTGVVSAAPGVDVIADSVVWITSAAAGSTSESAAVQHRDIVRTRVFKVIAASSEAWLKRA